MVGRIEQLIHILSISRGHHHQAGDTATKGSIKTSSMCSTIGTDDGESNIQSLHGNIVNQLVVGTLQEGRINGDNRFQPIPCHTCSQSHRMLFGYADIVVALGNFAGKLDQSGAFTHGRCDCVQQRVLFTFGNQPVGKDIGI